MVQLAQLPLWIDEEAPVLELEMPRVYRLPAISIYRRGKGSLEALLANARAAYGEENPAHFGRIYGELTSEFQPSIQWAQSCWEYLLSTQGCRFLSRLPQEKLYCRGDYRVFTEKDYQKLIYRIFKSQLAAYLESPTSHSLEQALRENFWDSIEQTYQALENPSDPTQRKLTGYSYLRCVPYRFLNPYHHERVYQTVGKLPPTLREAVELYHLAFYKEEAVLERLQINQLTFRRRRRLALRLIAAVDYLSSILLQQIERY